MVEDNQQYAYFALEGGFDPADITARVGAERTECWRRGDICDRTRRERQPFESNRPGGLQKAGEPA